MAELVNLRLEHTLAELEEMQRVGLFSSDEIRKIVKKRKSFEYKLRRNLKRKEDFLKYIEYEKCLLSLISKRRERLLCESKTQEIDHKVAKRINRLYKGAISRFPDDSNLYLQQIQFCKTMKWYDNINAIHVQMLKTHSRNPSLWVVAANWEMDESRSPENARKLFQRGVLINPKSKVLWLEYFKMELKYIDLIKKRREVLQLQQMEDPNAEENDVVLNGKIPNVIFDNALMEIHDDVEFALSFIKICLEFDFGHKHVDYILDKVSELYPESEETLDALAKRPLLNIEEKIKVGKEQGVKKKTTLKKINEEIFSMYEKSVREQPTEKMWSFFIDYVQSLIEASKENKKSSLQDKIMEIMERAASQNCLSFTYYPHWIDLLISKGDDTKALSISIHIAKKEKTTDLWIQCLSLHIKLRQPVKQIYSYLLEAIKSVPEEGSIPLWKLGVEFLSLYDPDHLIAFFEIGIKKSSEISTPIKEMYLEILVLSGSIEKARSLYKRFKQLGPVTHHIVKKMIELEKAQLNPPPIMILRRYFEDSILESGATSVDLWLDYIKLEIEHANGNSAAISTLMFKAKRSLKPEYQEDFQNRLTEFVTTNHSS